MKPIFKLSKKITSELLPKLTGVLLTFNRLKITLTLILFKLN